MRWVTTFLHEEESATAVEYSVMLAMILLVILGTVGVVGSQTGGLWGGIDSDLQDSGF